jgi:hypothetical protein
MTIVPFLNKINALILNPLIILAFAVALLVFFWGIVQFINSETSDAKRGEGKNKIIYGLVGMFIMISAYGIIRLILNTFGLSQGPTYPGF